MSKLKYYKTKIFHAEKYYHFIDYLILIGGILLLIWGLVLLVEIIAGVGLAIAGISLIFFFLRRRP